jgi:O-antigen/teichoic acid export membrane protein
MRILLKYLKKFFNVGMGKFLSIASNFMLLFIITNSFSVEDSGFIFLIFSVVNFLIFLSRFGQDQLIVKYNNTLIGNKNLNISFSIVLIVSTFCFLVTLLLSSFNLFFVKTDSFSWIFISVIPLSCTWVLIGYFRSNNLQFLANFSENGVFQFLLIVFLFFIPKSLHNLYLSYVFFGFLSFIILLLLSLKIGLRFKFSLQDSLNNFRIGFKIMSSSLFSFLIINLPIYFAGFFNLMEDITIYTICLRISIVVNIGMAIINSLYSPKYANSFRVKEYLYLQKYYRQARIELILLCFIPFIIVFTIPNTILGYFDAASQSNTLILRFFILCQYLCVSTGTTGVFLNIIDKESSMQRNNLIGLIASIFIALVYYFYYQNIYLMVGMFAIGVILENFLSLMSVKKFFSEKN